MPGTIVKEAFSNTIITGPNGERIKIVPIEDLLTALENITEPSYLGVILNDRHSLLKVFPNSEGPPAVAYHNLECKAVTGIELDIIAHEYIGIDKNDPRLKSYFADTYQTSFIRQCALSGFVTPVLPMSELEYAFDELRKVNFDHKKLAEEVIEVKQVEYTFSEDPDKKSEEIPAVSHVQGTFFVKNPPTLTEKLHELKEAEKNLKN